MTVCASLQPSAYKRIMHLISPGYGLPSDKDNNL